MCPVSCPIEAENVCRLVPVPIVGCMRGQHLSQKSISYSKSQIESKGPGTGPKQRLVVLEQALDVGVEGKPRDLPETACRQLGAFFGMCPVSTQKGQVSVMFLGEEVD